jgi:hypothetical protein
LISFTVTAIISVFSKEVAKTTLYIKKIDEFSPLLQMSTSQTWIAIRKTNETKLFGIDTNWCEFKKKEGEKRGKEQGEHDDMWQTRRTTVRR